jgi:hypothetical protein
MAERLARKPIGNGILARTGRLGRTQISYNLLRKLVLFPTLNTANSFGCGASR